MSLKLILKGAYYHSLNDKDYHDILKIFDYFSQLDPIRQYLEIFDLKAQLIKMLSGDEVLYYICRVCQESRSIDQICDLMTIREVTQD